jgi:hypothetical protein
MRKISEFLKGLLDSSSFNDPEPLRLGIKNWEALQWVILSVYFVCASYYPKLSKTSPLPLPGHEAQIS